MTTRSPGLPPAAGSGDHEEPAIMRGRSSASNPHRQERRRLRGQACGPVPRTAAAGSAGPGVPQPPRLCRPQGGPCGRREGWSAPGQTGLPSATDAPGRGPSRRRLTSARGRRFPSVPGPDRGPDPGHGPQHRRRATARRRDRLARRACRRLEPRRVRDGAERVRAPVRGAARRPRAVDRAAAGRIVAQGVRRRRGPRALRRNNDAAYPAVGSCTGPQVTHDDAFAERMRPVAQGDRVRARPATAARLSTIGSAGETARPARTCC